MSSTDLVVIDETPAVVAERWLRTAWEQRVADGKTAPVLAAGRNGNAYVALRRIVTSLVEGGNDPREVALAIYHNDGAWTTNALLETMRQRRARRGTAAEAPVERNARMAAMHDAIDSGTEPDWLRTYREVSA